MSVKVQFNRFDEEEVMMSLDNPAIVPMMGDIIIDNKIYRIVQRAYLPMVNSKVISLANPHSEILLQCVIMPVNQQADGGEN